MKSSHLTSRINLISGASPQLLSEPLLSVVLDCDESELSSLDEFLYGLSNQVYNKFELIVRTPSPHSVLSSVRLVAPSVELACLDSRLGITLSGVARACRGQYLLFLGIADRLIPSAFERLVNQIAGKEGQQRPDLILFDHVIPPETKRFLPGWDPDLIKYNDYIQSACIIAKSLVDNVPPCTTLYDLLKQLSSKRLVVGHVQESLGFLNRELPPSSSLPVPTQQSLPSLTVIIPNKNKPDLLKSCVEFLQYLQFKFELIVVDNGSTDPLVWELYSELSSKYDVTVAHFNRSFNYSAMINAASSLAKNEFLFLLNNDVQITDAREVLKALAYAQDDQVGVVGSLLRYSDGTVQHAGMALFRRNNEDFDTVHVLRFARDDEGEHIGALTAPRNWQSVTGAFQIVRKSDFLSTGGYDEVNLPIEFNDVDFCLRIRRSGLRVVCLPLAGVFHNESQTRAQIPLKTARASAHDAYEIMRSRWEREYSSDPFINKTTELFSFKGKQSSKIFSIYKAIMRSLSRNKYSAIPKHLNAFALRARMSLRMTMGVNIIHSSSTKLLQMENRIAMACKLAGLPVRHIEPAQHQSPILIHTKYDVFPDGLLSVHFVQRVLLNPRRLGTEGRLCIGYVIKSMLDCDVEKLELSCYDEIWACSLDLQRRLCAVFAGRIRVISPPGLDGASMQKFGREVTAVLEELQSIYTSPKASNHNSVEQ